MVNDSVSLESGALVAFVGGALGGVFGGGVGASGGVGVGVAVGLEGGSLGLEAAFGVEGLGEVVVLGAGGVLEGVVFDGLAFTEAGGILGFAGASFPVEQISLTRIAVSSSMVER